jgi:hypothetical protein
VTGRAVKTVTLHWALSDVGQTDIALSLILKLHRDKSYFDSDDQGFRDSQIDEGEQFQMVWFSKL